MSSSSTVSGTYAASVPAAAAASQTTSTTRTITEGIPRPLVVEDEDLAKSAFTTATTVYDMPISAIARPLQSTVDEDKVQAFMGKIESGIDMTPIEVMHYEKRHPTTGEELHYYVSVGGCHRWTAHKRLGKETIPARIIEVTEDTLRGYLGASLKLKDDVQEV